MSYLIKQILYFCHEVVKQQIKIESNQTKTCNHFFFISSNVIFHSQITPETIVILNEVSHLRVSKSHTNTLSIVCRYLTDKTGGGALSDPEAELPLLSLPQLSFCTSGDEHWVLIYQGLMKNLKHGSKWIFTYIHCIASSKAKRCWWT